MVELHLHKPKLYKFIYSRSYGSFKDSLMFSYSVASNVEMMGELWIGRDAIGSWGARGTGGIVKTHENRGSSGWDLNSGIRRTKQRCQPLDLRDGSRYCLCVNVYCTTATGCQPSCSWQIYIIYHITYHVIISYIISYYIIYHVISYHISYRIISCISYHRSYHVSCIMSYHIVYHIIYHVISYHIISYIIILATPELTVPTVI